MNLAQLLVRTAKVFADRPALYLGEELICNYRELERRAKQVAGTLRDQLQLQAGDRVGILMSNIPEYLEVLYGCWFGGFVAVPINAKLHAREAEHILRDSGASALFVSSDLASGMRALSTALPSIRAMLTPGTAEYSAIYQAKPLAQAVHCERDDLAWLFYTSGTTGRPKGVMLSHGNLLTMIACLNTDIDMPQLDDSVVYAAPMSHAAGMLNFAHVMAGASHIVPASAGFDPAELAGLAARRGRLAMFAAPTMVKRLVDHIEHSGEGASGFKTILYGGGPMYLEDIRQALRVMGDCFAQIYGQGETPMTITALGRHHYRDSDHPRYEQRLASVGVAQSFVEVRVGDSAGQPIPLGETGEVLVRGDSVMKGYWQNPEATAQAIRDGWLFTGDIGCFDEDGFLTLKDRSKDVIISGGSNIYPREVEEVLLQHPGVHEVSVIGRKDPEWGEEVVAFVVTREGVSLRAAELDDLCLHHIARFKRPKQYRFVESLPKSNYGKILKTELREWLVAEAGNGDPNVRLKAQTAF